MTVDQLPTLNALLNATAAVLLVIGYVMIRRRHVRAHKALMLSAFAVSSCFLVSYVIYHWQRGSMRFTGPAQVRHVYLAILGTHVVLAATVPLLAMRTIYLGLRDIRDRHRRLARWTLPIWLYVSVTGVVIYAMLYHLYPASSP